MGAILEEEEAAVQRVTIARDWILEHVSAEVVPFSELLDAVPREAGADDLTALAAVWDLISSGELELLPGSRVRRSPAA